MMQWIDIYSKLPLGVKVGVNACPGGAAPLVHSQLGFPPTSSYQTRSVFSCTLFSTVSIDDIESVRPGHLSEGLQKYANDVPEDQCFSIIFKGKRNNLDLIAGSVEDASKWVTGLEKVITNMHNLNSQQKSEQYPLRAM